MIGQYQINGHALLAPMAGVTDAPFRQLCLGFGAALATSEMLTSDTRLWQSNKSKTRLPGAPQLTTTDGAENNARQSDLQSEIPESVQIAGSEADMMAHAAEKAEALGAQIIDINMGCPAKKVCKKLAGSALMRDEKRVESILKAVVDSVNVPVTLKTRTGWDTGNKNGVRVANIAEQCGVKALSVHGRTRACRFEGQAEYDTIAKIVDAVSIPVFANGDIDSGEKALQVLKHTRAAGVMVGRGALGKPWIFKEINKAIEGRQEASSSKPVVSNEDVLKTILSHLKGLHSLYGPNKGVKIARKHFGWYIKNLALTVGDAPQKALEKTLESFKRIEHAEAQLQSAYNLYEKILTQEELAA